MARLYRRKKRKAAHWILGQLVDNNSFVITNNEGRDVYKKEYAFISINELSRKTRKFPINIIRDAAHFLYKNEHITTLTNLNDFNETQLKANINGEYAYRDSYYLMENRKDFNETIDSYTKWIIPLFSLIISILAIYFSTNTTQNTKNIPEQYKTIDTMQLSKKDTISTKASLNSERDTIK